MGWGGGAVVECTPAVTLTGQLSNADAGHYLDGWLSSSGSTLAGALALFQAVVSLTGRPGVSILWLGGI